MSHLSENERLVNTYTAAAAAVGLILSLKALLSMRKYFRKRNAFDHLHTQVHAAYIGTLILQNTFVYFLFAVYNLSYGVTPGSCNTSAVLVQFVNSTAQALLISFHIALARFSEVHVSQRDGNGRKWIVQYFGLPVIYGVITTTIMLVLVFTLRPSSPKEKGHFVPGLPWCWVSGLGGFFDTGLPFILAYGIVAPMILSKPWSFYKAKRKASLKVFSLANKSDKQLFACFLTGMPSIVGYGFGFATRLGFGPDLVSLNIIEVVCYTLNPLWCALCWMYIEDIFNLHGDDETGQPLWRPLSMTMILQGETVPQSPLINYEFDGEGFPAGTYGGTAEA